MAYSYQTATSDGTLSLLDVTFPYIERSHVRVYFDEVEFPAGSGWNWVGVSEARISFSPAVPAGVVVLLRRATPADRPLHVFAEGAAFNRESLDDDFRQALFIAQESQEANLVGDYFTDINMHGYQIRNIGVATNDSDALTLGQYKADVDGAYAASQTAIQAANDAVAAVAAVQGTVTQVQDIGPRFASKAQLRAYTGPALNSRLTPLSIAGDFVRDTADSTTPDNDVTVLVDSSGRRIKRVVEGHINAQWAGAVPDYNGTSGTLNTAALQNAIDVAANTAHRRVLVPAGRYLTDTLNMRSYVTLELSPGAELVLVDHASTHNPLIRMGNLSAGIVGARVIGGKLNGRKAGQVGEWSHGVFIWGSNGCTVQSEIVDCAGDGVCIGYDVGRVVGAHANDVTRCEIYGCTRMQIAITYGNRNYITYNRISGAIDLELNADIGECKSNFVVGNTGRLQVDDATNPHRSDLQISLASLNLEKSRYHGNVVARNHCYLVSGQYNLGTILSENVIVGSNSTQQYLLDWAAFDECVATNNLLIANAGVATSLVTVLRTRACRSINVTDNVVNNGSLPFHSPIAGFGPETASNHNFRDNLVTGAGRYRNGGAINPSEYARFRLDIAGGVKTVTQLAGVPCNFYGLASSAQTVILSNFGGAGADFRLQFAQSGSTTAANATDTDAIIAARVVASGSSRTVTLFAAPMAAGALTLAQFLAATASGTFYFEVWY